jgi:uncharacterized membrane protein
MPKNKIIVTLAVLIALLPILGFSHRFESFFQVFAGVAIILLSVWSTIDKYLSHRAKAEQRRRRKIPKEVEETLDERSTDRRSDDRRSVPGTVLDREEIIEATEVKE